MATSFGIVVGIGAAAVIAIIVAFAAALNRK